jgi:hypothetical protein
MQWIRQGRGRKAVSWAARVLAYVLALQALLPVPSSLAATRQHLQWCGSTLVSDRAGEADQAGDLPASRQHHDCVQICNAGSGPATPPNEPQDVVAPQGLPRTIAGTGQQEQVGPAFPPAAHRLTRAPPVIF